MHAPGLSALEMMAVALVWLQIMLVMLLPQVISPMTFAMVRVIHITASQQRSHSALVAAHVRLPLRFHISCVIHFLRALHVRCVLRVIGFLRALTIPRCGLQPIRTQVPKLVPR